jgi:hypothetical protein
MTSNMDDYQIEVCVDQLENKILKVVDFYVLYQPIRWNLDKFNTLMHVIQTRPYTPRVDWGGFIVKVTLNSGYDCNV